MDLPTNNSSIVVFFLCGINVLVNNTYNCCIAYSQLVLSKLRFVKLLDLVFGKEFLAIIVLLVSAKFNRSNRSGLVALTAVALCLSAFKLGLSVLGRNTHRFGPVCCFNVVAMRSSSRSFEEKVRHETIRAVRAAL